MADKDKITSSQSCPDDTVYVLEGEPNEVYDAQGNRIELTPEQQEQIEKQI